MLRISREARAGSAFVLSRRNFHFESAPNALHHYPTPLDHNVTGRRHLTISGTSLHPGQFELKGARYRCPGGKPIEGEIFHSTKTSKSSKTTFYRAVTIDSWPRAKSNISLADSINFQTISADFQKVVGRNPAPTTTIPPGFLPQTYSPSLFPPPNFIQASPLPSHKLYPIPTDTRNSDGEVRERRRHFHVFNHRTCAISVSGIPRESSSSRKNICQSIGISPLPSIANK